MISLRRKKSAGRSPIERSKKPFSYYKSGVTGNTPASTTPEHRGRERPSHKPVIKKSHRGAAYSVLAIVVLVLVTVSSYIDTNILRFNKSNEAAYLKPNDEYINGVRSVLNEDLRNRSKLTIDTNGLASKIRTVFPEFSDVDVGVPLIGTAPTVRATIDEAVLVVDNGSTYSYVSARGRIVGQTQKSSDTAPDLPLLLDTSTLSVKVGDAYLASEEIVFISNLRAQAVASGTAISSVTLPALPRELHVRFSEDEDIYVKFYTGGDANIQFGTYKAVSKHLKEQGKAPKEYIDVRVEERAYSK